MDKLEKLLETLRAYGVTEYSDKEVQVSFAPTAQIPVLDEGEFAVDFSGAVFPGEDDDLGNN